MDKLDIFNYIFDANAVKGNKGVQEYHDFLVRTKIQTFRISETKLRMCSQTHWNEKVQRTLKSYVQPST